MFCYVFFLWSFFVTSSFALPSCPSLCECDKKDSSWNVYCRKAVINDTVYAEVLNQLPLTLRSLHIQPPTNRGGSNKLRWNDNINRFAQLRVLRLINCQIPAMSRSIRLPSLEVLDLRSNNIEHATMSNFGGMPKLRVLDLSSNHLNILPTGVFTYLRQLRSLSLSNNTISDLSTNLLRGLNSLRVLRLDRNPIPIEQINDLFTDISQLDELYLNHCNLSSISLLALDRIPQLRQLGIGGNDLKHVPSKEMRSLSQLSVLDLSYNSIQEIPACALCNTNVSKLDLSNNLLGIAKGSQFNEDAFRNIPLRHLDLSFNHLDEFDSKWLGWAQEELTSIALSGNLMKHFDEVWTHSLKSLVHLEMAYNHIKYIPVQLPTRYYHLTSFNISGNELSYLPDNINNLLPNVKALDISTNRFHTFSHTDLAFLNNLDQVYVDGNPWDCSCAIQGLQVHMRDRYAMRHILNYENVRCATPSLVEGHSVLAITDVNDCAVLFGARYGLTQTSEMLILLAGVLLFAAFLLMILGCIYFLRERQYKGSYVTREHSRTPLTMANTHSCSSSTNDTHGPLSPPFDPFLVSTETFKATPPLIPPISPKPGSSYFGI
ncbi:hypothetical protein L3Y34_014590 [Caenorhabditis briggsae]|uniref:LRRCT domain-containing protein n=1 Tax=Caenorhabditis briggsae TaxID=6238 RepID=A0AAE9DRG9_CAEBR|nr:hypothetical protein L3Y34_014590 [Caenorhabditis briggsae]